MVEPFIIVQRCFGVAVESLMHSGLRRGTDKPVIGGDMQHDWSGDRILFIQQAINPDAIIADAGIDIGACRAYECQAAPQAISNAADFCDPLGVARLYLFD